MQKHVLFNAAGIVVLSLMCACGPLADKKEEAEEETTTEALAEISDSVQSAADEALAQAAMAEGEGALDSSNVAMTGAVSADLACDDSDTEVEKA